jgi:DNA-binding NtrC family response regulator
MGNVLIVDDEPAIGDYLARLISGFRHEVTTSESASDALAKITDGNFHLIIADIRLPDAPDPKDWILQLRQKADKTPVVLISGLPTNELTDFASANGVLAFLTKPFELAFIKNILKTVFGA